jgi:hypothetical protein
MTKQSVGKASNIVIPVSAFIAVLTALASLYGVVPPISGTNSDIERRMTVVEVRQIELEKQAREDRNEIMRAIYSVEGAVKRIEGKLEK